MGVGGNSLSSSDPSRAAIRLAFGCDDALAQSIAALGRETAQPRGAVLWPQSDRHEAILMLAGRAQEVAYGRDGTILLLHLLGPGDLFGDLVGGGDPVSQVEAVDHGRGAHFASATIRLMESYSCVGLAISFYNWPGAWQVCATAWSKPPCFQRRGGSARNCCVGAGSSPTGLSVRCR